MSGSCDAPTAEAALELDLKQWRGRAGLRVDGAESARLIKSFERLVLAGLGAATVVGTFYGAAAAHIPSGGTIGLVAGELLLIADVAVRRRKR